MLAKPIFNCKSIYMRKLLLISLFLLASSVVRAQIVAVKTNLLYDATTTINLGLEFGLSHQWTLDVSGSINPWIFRGDRQFRIWMAQPEIRYWFCEKFNGHFVGLHAMGGLFNVGNVELPFGILASIRDRRYDGWYAGGGLTYGYQWVLGHHWNFEAAIGVGYDYVKNDKYKCGKCGEKVGSGHYNYWGPTKLALTAIYVF